MTAFGVDTATVRFSPNEQAMCHIQAILYSRNGCLLCDQARKLLKEHGVDVCVIDIEKDAKLVARYDECVPVVEIDGRERFRGSVNPVLLRRLLASRRS